MMKEIYSNFYKHQVEFVMGKGPNNTSVKYEVNTKIDGSKVWMYQYRIHRIDGPAIIFPNGEEHWYYNGDLHRDGGPAVVSSEASYWYNQGQLHREDGPAIVDMNAKYYYRNNLLHREDGPAIEYNNGSGHWYLNGIFQKEVNTMPIYNKKFKPQTQKAKSILFGCLELQEDASYCYSLRGYGTKSLKMTDPILIQNEIDIKELDSRILDNMIFARPCPKTPRHGFVDSRLISNKDDLKNLFTEVKQADPKGEIVLTRFLDKAVCSAVLTTNGTISIGPGHNGATSGKKSFSFSVKPEELPKRIKSRAGITNYDNAFIETVFSPHEDWVESFYYTQVRGGPSIDAVKDFVPKKTIVKKIIKPNDDLVAWEKEVKKLSPGTVVYGPGHTLASHAAIHCVINNIPFITSFKPKVGQQVKPSLVAKAKYNSRQFQIAFTLGIDSKIEMCQMLHTSVAILHNWAYLRTSDQASWLLGLCAGFFLKVLCALNLGEYRYVNNSESPEINREQVYKNVMKTKKFSFYMSKCPKIAKDFKNKKLFNSGFGGNKWSKAAYMCVDIWNVVAKITNSSLNEAKANELISILNKSVNLVHNNGWLFNKISDETLMDFIAKHSSLALLQLSDVIYKHLLQSKKIKRLRKFNTVMFEK